MPSTWHLAARRCQVQRSLPAVVSRTLQTFLLLQLLKRCDVCKQASLSLFKPRLQWLLPLSWTMCQAKYLMKACTAQCRAAAPEWQAVASRCVAHDPNACKGFTCMSTSENKRASSRLSHTSCHGGRRRPRQLKCSCCAFCRCCLCHLRSGVLTWL